MSNKPYIFWLLVAIVAGFILGKIAGTFIAGILTVVLVVFAIRYIIKIYKEE